MVSQARTSQGGSVINFLIVGVLLTVVTLGAVYIIQQRHHTDQTGPIVSSPSPSPTATPSRSPEMSPSSSPSASPSATPVPSAPSSVPSTGYLPQTGPADTLFGMMVPAMLLFGTGVAYGKSRRERFGSLRR